MWLFKKSATDREKNMVLYNATRGKSYHKYLCNAPFISLYFGLDGKISPCCYNRWYVLGTYPQQQLKDIWHGEKINVFRKNMKNFDFGLGCDVCKQDFLSKNFSSVKALHYDGITAKESQPLILEFELNNICNLSCKMCDEHHSSVIQKEKFPFTQTKTAYDEDFIEQLTPWLKNIVDARFNGGEPFLNSMYFKIWEKIINMNPACSISIQTNGTLLDDKIINLLDKGRFNISVSLDALNKELYETIRPHAVFDKTMSHIAFFIDYCRTKNTHFSIAVCPMRLNWKELPGLINFANENQIKFDFHTVWYPPSLALWNLKSEELEHIYKYLNRFRWTAKSENEKYNVELFRSLLTNIELWKIKAINHEKLFNCINDSKTLKEILLNNLNNWCTINILNKEICAKRKERYKQIVEEVEKPFSEKLLLKIYYEILKTPPDFIIQILNSDDENEIMTKFNAYNF